LNRESDNTNEGYAQNNPHLRKMEEEAYEKGNMILRDWEDQRKQIMNENKEHDEEEKDEIDPLRKEKANDHYAKRAEKVFKELADRWGFGSKQKKEDNK